jgi:hypothetical protein
LATADIDQSVASIHAFLPLGVLTSPSSKQRLCQMARQLKRLVKTIQRLVWSAIDVRKFEHAAPPKVRESERVYPMSDSATALPRHASLAVDFRDHLE